MPSALVDNDFFLDFDSVSVCDSQGKLLNQKQADFFKNSKCIDEDGALYRLYQASNSDFNAFDKSFGYNMPMSYPAAHSIHEYPFLQPMLEH